MPVVGFILLTHGQPDQIIRLIEKLNSMFGFPPIVIHHDFSKCPLNKDEAPFTHNVSFVLPHSRTGWGEFSIVEITCRAIRKMYDLPSPPDWFVVLSGADYPIKPAARVLADLQAAPCDAFVSHRLIDTTQLGDEFAKRCFRRYCWVKIPVPRITNGFRIGMRQISSGSRLIRLFALPFGRKLDCYAGSHWFTANRRAANYILAVHGSPLGRRLSKHYRKCEFPEESYFQTILVHGRNTAGLVLENDNLRYTDWSAGGPHPKTLGASDVPNLLSSNAHFARKFAPQPDDNILQLLDRAVAETGHVVG